MNHVVAAVICVERKVLALRRSGVLLSGYYEFPGGKVEQDESHTCALVRELREELDLYIDQDDPKPLLLNCESEQREDIKLHFYKIVLSEIPKISLTVHDDAQWVSVSEIESLRWLPSNKAVIRKYLDDERQIR